MRLPVEAEKRLPHFVRFLEYDIVTTLPRWAQLLMRLNRAVALTIGHTIYVEPAHYDPDSISGLALLAHELTHVRQWARDGWWHFAVRYGLEYLRRGYYGVSYERQAYAVQHAARRMMEAKNEVA